MSAKIEFSRSSPPIPDGDAVAYLMSWTVRTLLALPAYYDYDDDDYGFYD